MKVRVIPVSGLVRVTEACGTRAPDESVTMPERVAVVVANCAVAGRGKLARKASRIAIAPQYHGDG